MALRPCDQTGTEEAERTHQHVPAVPERPSHTAPGNWHALESTLITSLPDTARGLTGRVARQSALATAVARLAHSRLDPILSPPLPSRNEILAINAIACGERSTRHAEPADTRW